MLSIEQNIIYAVALSHHMKERTAYGEEIGVRGASMAKKASCTPSTPIFPMLFYIFYPSFISYLSSLISYRYREIGVQGVRCYGPDC